MASAWNEAAAPVVFHIWIPRRTCSIGSATGPGPRRVETVSEKWKKLEREEADYEAGHLVRDIAVGTITTGLATLAGPVAAVGAASGWGAKSIAGRYRREREREGED